MNYDQDFGGDTDVIDLPLREPAPAIVRDRVPTMDAVPVHVVREYTRPYRFSHTRVIVRVA